MEDNRLAKVDILLQQNKLVEAKKILNQLLSEDPNDVMTLTLLSNIYFRQDKFETATELIDKAIGLEPNNPHFFYLKATFAHQQDKAAESEKNINHAIELDPNNAHYFALSSTIKIFKKQYSEALKMADNALAIDPTNLFALNTRSTALKKLNRGEESLKTIEGALREAPNSSYTHANYGWALLEQGDHVKALTHFKQSLVNDPTSQFAHSGMMEALKATNPLYRAFLKYAFWMANLTSKYQWGILIAFFLAFRMLRSISEKNETLQPYLTPLIILIALIAFSTWVIQPLSNLFLRFNRYGSVLLERKEKISSNFVAASLAVSVIGTLLYAVLSDQKYLTIAVFGFGMMIPFSVMFLPTKHKNSLLIYAAIMAVIGISAIVLTFLTGELFNVLTPIFIVGLVTFQWVSNYLLIGDDK